MTTVEIYFDDLSEKKQKEMLEAAGVDSPDEMNWDSIPVSCVDFEEEG